MADMEFAISLYAMPYAHIYNPKAFGTPSHQARPITILTVSERALRRAARVDCLPDARDRPRSHQRLTFDVIIAGSPSEVQSANIRCP